MNSYSADLVFDVNSLPEITISTNGSAQALEGKQATLSLDQTLPANYNYQWFKNNELIGEQSYAVVLAEPGVTYQVRSEEHTSELQSLMRISYAVFCWKKK